MKRIGYKLTTQEMTTYLGFKWELGVRQETSGNGDLCSAGWLHYYSDPLLAVLHNCIHADIQAPRLFKAEIGPDQKDDRGMKAGTTKMTLLKELNLPEVTAEIRIRYAIGCALAVYKKPQFREWAERWLDGTDRSYGAARTSATYASSAAASATSATYASATSASYASYAASASDAYAASATSASYACAASPLNLAKIAKWAFSLKSVKNLKY